MDGRFPETRHSVVDALGADDAGARERALGALAETYWKPVYTYLRLRWRLPPERAEDLTQGFFAHAIEKRTLAGFDAARARFRTWMRTCVDGFVANESKAERRLKRGGEAPHVSFDVGAVERELDARPAADDVDPDALFHREWLRSLLALAIEDLRRDAGERGRELDFTIFERYDVAPLGDADRPTYAALAAELGVPVTRVTNTLHAERRRFRAAALARLREICAGEREFRAEARELFGTDAP